MQGNTLADPKFKDGEQLKTFDYVVANPPFSDKRWSTGLDPLNDPYRALPAFGVPPAKQGDYAYLLHIVRSLKSTGKGACILPHGVLFRGNAEADIRRSSSARATSRASSACPPISSTAPASPPASSCSTRRTPHARKGIFMIDASKGFMKDGPKNRLRAQDIHQIVDVFTRRLEVPRYSRMVPFDEIDRRTTSTSTCRATSTATEPEDMQDIDGHLRGGIPDRRHRCARALLGGLPAAARTLCSSADRPGYLDLAVEKPAIKSAIYEPPRVRRLHRQA